MTIHMVSSLDGFIAKKDNSIGWFETTDQYEKGGTEDFFYEVNKTLGRPRQERG